MPGERPRGNVGGDAAADVPAEVKADGKV